MPGRRAQLRAELMAAVRAAARDNLRAQGPAGLSLRAVARDVGISPAGLYRYFDGRDALLTMLIAEGYGDLADHLFLAQGATDLVAESDRTRDVPHAVAATADVADRIRATWRTYRDWARAHPNEFHLLFGEPIEGYAAPVDGATSAANARMAQALVMPLLEAHLAGRLAVPDLGDPAPAASLLAAEMGAVAPIAPSPAFATLTVSWWSVLHGAVALERNGQFHWLGEDAGTELFEHTMASALAAVDG